MKITIDITERNTIHDKEALFKAAVKDLDKLYDYLNDNITVFSAFPPEYYDPIAKITVEK